MPISVHVIRGGELDGELCEAWRSIQSADHRLGSPYLCPEFTQAVAAVREDVFVGVMRDGSQIVGFVPFQRRSAFWRTAGPVGGALCDCQAVVVGPETEWSARDLIRGCGLKLWDYDHLLAYQNQFEQRARAHDESPVIELGAGFAAYAAERKASGSNRIDQLQRKWRKLERERGAEQGLRFEVMDANPGALRRVIEWKIEQCERTGSPVFFRERWAVEMVERIFATGTPGFAGALSVLYVGDEIAAAHFGMRSASVWHWWFPAYSEAFSVYSPGGLLLLKLAEHVGEFAQGQPASGPVGGVTGERVPSVIDLGKGTDAYKQSFANGAVPLLEGSVSLGSVYGQARGARRSAVAGLKASPVGGFARVLKRRVRGGHGPGSD